jgi:hypothetical protein
MISTLAIFTAGAAERPAVACYAVLATSPSPHEARSFSLAFVNNAPARRAPMTASLPAGLRAPFSLPTPAF